jgi:hypothetical protein
MKEVNSSLETKNLGQIICWILNGEILLDLSGVKILL